ncbi:hypothetical protein BT69DRAFT_1339399, partial [Atractiella rhizophila]
VNKEQLQDPSTYFRRTQTLFFSLLPSQAKWMPYGVAAVERDGNVRGTGVEVVSNVGARLGLLPVR